MDELIQKVLANIQSVMAESTSLSAPFYEAVLKRLVSFGFELKEDDGLGICFAMQKVENHIKNTCNIAAVPDGLFNVAVDMVCGEVLNARFLSGQLDLNALDLDGMIKSVSLGDTSVTFNEKGSDEAKLKELLSWLIYGREGDLVCYRKMRW